ncbi:MAG: c-type cytochrome [Abditibacteriales bacterium]|nr:c-type cytochrome [Abditibacteriales bacterium]MDW8364678.1 c-type cytochrome [Abditibacteriales bacterium]
MKRRQLSIMGGIGLVVGLVWLAWADEKIPPEYAKLKNPVKATPQSIAAGKKIYTEKCEACHGKTGKGDGQVAKTMPNVKMPDLSTAEFAKESEQEIFWIISEGKEGTVMKGFKKEVKDNDRWHLVNYVRTFAPKPAKPAKK